MNASEQMSRTLGERDAPIPGWYTLFCGCFGSDAGSKKWARRGVWAAVFPAVGFAARFGLDGVLPEIVLDATMALSIAAAIAFVNWTTWRYMQDLDELHQRIMLEAYAFSFFGTMTLIAGVGMFGLATRTAFDVLWIYVAAEMLRGIGLVLAGRKYR